MYVFEEEKYLVSLIFHIEELAVALTYDFAIAPPTKTNPPHHGSTCFNLSAYKKPVCNTMPLDL
jgi:hypothetical protein